MPIVLDGSACFVHMLFVIIRLVDVLKYIVLFFQNSRKKSIIYHQVIIDYIRKVTLNIFVNLSSAIRITLCICYVSLSWDVVIITQISTTTFILYSINCIAIAYWIYALKTLLTPTWSTVFLFLVQSWHMYGRRLCYKPNPTWTSILNITDIFIHLSQWRT